MATSASQAAGLPIHGAGSDDGAVVTLTDTRRPMTLAGLTGPAACTNWASDTAPPTTIRVYRTRTGTVDTIDFRAYARKVVAAEFTRTWPFQLLAVGAIVAKQNAWFWTMHGRDWSNLAGFGGRANPIQKVALPSGQYQWQTSAASPSGAGLCWDISDTPAIDQCYDCGSTPLDPSAAPRNQAALDATWWISIRRPRSGVESLFAPGYNGAGDATCPSMATQADWERWFTGRLDFDQAYACATTQGESAAMLLRRFLSSALEIHDPGRSDLTGDGIGDVPILRAGPDASGAQSLALDPATADPAYLATGGSMAPPILGPDPGTTLARAVGRLDRPDRASLVSLSSDPSGTMTITARSLDAPGALRTTPWWTGRIPGFDPAAAISLSVADITGDMRPDVLVLERARAVGPDGVTATWSLRLWVLATTDAGPDPAGFAAWANLGPFPAPPRFERLGDVDGDGRVDLVFATGDGAPFLVARALRNGTPALGPPEPYGALVSPAVADEWPLFALADGSGTGRDEPVIAATGGAATALGGPASGLALLTATASSDPTTYAFGLAPLRLTWSAPDPALAAGVPWAGDVAGDGRADLAVLNASDALPAQPAGDPAAARLALVQVRDGATPPSIPRLDPAALGLLRVVAPGDQGVPPARISLTVPSSTVTWGSSVTVTARFATSGAARSFELQATSDASTWTTVARPTTNADGTAAVTLRPGANAWYRAVYVPGPSDDLAAGTSPVVRVLVRQVVLLRPHSAATRTVGLGSTTSFATTVRPAGPTIPPAGVVYSVYRRVAGTWRLLTTRSVVVDASGVARLAWKWTARGDYMVRAAARSTAQNANSALSPAETYAVR